MENQEIRIRVVKAIASLQDLLIAIDSDKLKEAKPVSGVDLNRTVCPICKGNLDDGTGLERGVHSRCYKRLQREKRITEAEMTGVLFPKQAVGRRTKIDLDEVLKTSSLEMAREAKSIADKAFGRKKPKG